MSQYPKFNAHFIDKLTPLSAWVMGWIASDGCVFVSQRQSYVVLTLAQDSIDVLSKISSAANGGNVRKYNRTGSYPNGQPIASLQFGSAHLVDVLESYGIGPRKSGKHGFHRRIIDGGEACVRAFIRGYFEGNGSVSISGIQPKVSFCGPHGFLVTLVGQLAHYCKIGKNNVRVHSQSDTVSELAYKCYPAMRIMDWMYAGTTEAVRGNRKWSLYNRIKQLVGGRFESERPPPRLVLFRGVRRTISEWSKVLGLTQLAVRHRADRGQALDGTGMARAGKLYRFRGKSMTLAEWARHERIGYGTLWDRLHNRNMTIKQAISIPVRRKA